MSTQHAWGMLAAFTLTVLCGVAVQQRQDIKDLREQIDYMKRDYEVLHGALSDLDYKVNSERATNGWQTDMLHQEDFPFIRGELKEISARLPQCAGFSSITNRVRETK